MAEKKIAKYSEAAFVQSFLSGPIVRSTDQSCSCRDPRHGEHGCTTVVHHPVICCTSCHTRGCTNRYGLTVQS